MRIALPLIFIIISMLFSINSLAQDKCEAPLLSLTEEECFTLEVLPDETLAACEDLSTFSYWLKLDVNPDNPNYRLQIDGTSIFDQVGVAVGHFSGGCIGEFTPYGDLFYCGDPEEPLLLKCLVPNHTTYILVSSNFPLNLCVTLTQEPIQTGCQANSNCNTPEFIELVASNGLGALVTGCTLNACSEYNSSSTCFGNSPVVWYTFRMPLESKRLYAQVTSNTIDRPVIRVFKNTCGQSPIGPCHVGEEGVASIRGLKLERYTTYYIAIGSADGNAGAFSLSLSASIAEETYCTLSSELIPYGTSLGSPLNGPYKPDEVVYFQFEFTYTSSQNNCQWAHGIIPILGEGWDLDFEMAPSWRQFNWFPQDTVTSKVNHPFIYRYEDDDGRVKLCHSYVEGSCPGVRLTEGTYMPAGYFWLYQASFTCPGANLANPNKTWGDPCPACGGVCTSSIYFQLKTKSGIQPEDYPVLSADISMYVFSDRQTGCWYLGEDDVCAADHPHMFNAVVEFESEDLLGVVHSETVCGNMPPLINISSIQNTRGKGYVWTPVNQQGVEGAEKGEGHILRPKLINTTNQTLIQSFEIRSIKENSDTSAIIGIIDIELIPSFELINDLVDEDVEYCVGDTILLEISMAENENSGPYEYLWQNGSSAPTLEYIIQHPGTQSVKLLVENSTGCSQMAQFDILSPPAPDPGLNVEYGEDGSANIRLSDDFASSEFEWLWPDGSTEPYLLNVDPGIYTLQVTNDLGCEFTFDVEVSICTLEVILEQQQDVACHGGQDGAISIYFEGAQGEVTLAWSDGNNQMSKDSLMAGTYALTATDGIGCPVSLQVTISQPDPFPFEIEGDLLFCEGGSTTLCVSETFDSVAWSSGDSSTCVDIFTPQEVSVVVQNESGCTSEQTVQVYISDTNETQWETAGDLICWYDTIQVCVINYDSIEWSDGSTANCKEITTGGTYYVNLVSPDGCNIQDSIFILPPSDALMMDAVILHHETSGQEDGSIKVFIGGGLPPYQYTWYMDDIEIESAQSELLTDIASGTYFVSVTDDAGCSQLFGPFEIDFTINTTEHQSSTQIQIFPNPTKSEIQIRNTIPLVKIEIIDLLGKPVSSHQLLQNIDKHTIEINNLSPGVYFIICHGKNNWKSVHKVIKQ